MTGAVYRYPEVVQDLEREMKRGLIVEYQAVGKIPVAANSLRLANKFMIAVAIAYNLKKWLN